MDYEHLIVAREGAAVWVTMNRPERLNALNPRLIEELRHFFTDLYWKHDIRVVVLKGAGRGFGCQPTAAPLSGAGQAAIRPRPISERFLSWPSNAPCPSSSPTPRAGT